MFAFKGYPGETNFQLFKTLTPMGRDKLIYLPKKEEGRKGGGKKCTGRAGD